MNTLDHQKNQQVSPRGNKTRNIAGGENDETEAVLLWAHLEKARVLRNRPYLFGKIEDSRRRGKANKWINSIKEAILMHLQELSWAVEDETL